MRRRARPAAAPLTGGPARTLSLVAAALLVAGAAVVVLLAATSVEGGWIGTALVTLVPWVAATTVVLVVVLLALREPGLAASALLVAVGATVLLVPRSTGGPEACEGGTPLTVAQLNVRTSRADPGRVADLVGDRGVQLLSLQEVDADLLDALSRAGLDQLLPEVVAEPTAGTSGGSVHATVPLESTREPAADGGSPDVEAEVLGVGAVRIDTTHPVPPIGPERHDAWRATLAGLPDPEPGVPSLVLGDLNATLDHGPLQQVLDRGWRDAAAAVGQGLRWTYLGVGAGTPAPPMVIDHVLVGPGVAVVDVWVADVPGSDHRMLGADLLLGC